MPHSITPEKRPSVERPSIELDFDGNVDVTNDLPTADALAKCADLLILDSKGNSRPFRSIYEGENVAPRQLIIFVRHFFCGNCQEYLRTLSSSITPDALLMLPVPTFVTIIGCGTPDLIDMYIETTNCPFPVYADPTRKLYEHLGMTRTLYLGKKTPEYMQSSLFGAVVHSIYQVVKNSNNALKGGDIKQIGGEFLLEKGEPLWCHRMRNTRDHAEVPELRRVLGLDDSTPPRRRTWSTPIKQLRNRSRSSSWGRARSRSNARKVAEKRESTEMERKRLLQDETPQVTPTTAM